LRKRSEMLVGNEDEQLLGLNTALTLTTHIHLAEEGIKESLIILDVKKTIKIDIDEIASRIGLLAEIYFVLPNQCRWILIVINPTGLHLQIDGLGVVRKVHRVVGSSLVEITTKKAFQRRLVFLFRVQSKG